MEGNAANPPRPTPRRFRRKHAVLVALVLIPLLLAGLYTYYGYSSRIQLQEIVEETDRLDPNWRLADLEAHRRDLPDADNGMVQAMGALRLLPAPWPTWDYRAPGETPEAEKIRTALSASFQELQPPHQLDDLQIQALRSELKRAVSSVAEARKLIDLPYGIQRLDWRPDFYSTLLPNTQKIRELANVLSYDILLQAQDRDFSQALRSARALLNTGRALGDEPTLISQLVRMAIDTMTFQRIERILAQGEPSPADLLAMQGAVAQEAAESLLYYGLRGERAGLDGFLEKVQRGELSFKNLSNLMAISRSVGALAGGKYVTVPVQEKLEAFELILTVRSQRAEALRYMNRLVEAAKLPPDQQMAAFRELESMNPTAMPLVIRLLGPAAFKVAQAGNRVRAQLRSTAVALAAERYRQARGRWPTKLDELVPRYLAAVPLDPFNGHPLNLGKQDQGIVVYSVGPDGVDNGGVVNVANPYAPGSDLGFRLWDVKHRRGPALPPKSPGEE
jgi:hypothetical protein